MSILTVETARPASYQQHYFATLEMPASWAEYQDAKERLRIYGDEDIKYSELCHCEYAWLAPHIRDHCSLPELNLLASRLDQHTKEDLDVYEAMVKIETRRGGGQPLPLSRLINLTFSIRNCHVADNVVSDTTLGKFLFENDMLQSEDAAAVKKRIETGKPVSDLLNALGKEHRGNEGGVYTGSGRYVEFDGVTENAYTPGKTPCFDRSDAPVVLQIRKGHFNDPAYDNNLTATLKLPLVFGSELGKALDAVEAASAEEIGYSCTDCLIPEAKEWINDAQNIEQAGEFAKALDHIARNLCVKEYKALLETARCENLEEALRLSELAGEYQLITDCPSPEVYARAALAKPEFAKISAALCKCTSLYDLGRELMAQDNTADTSYGLLSRKDGGPLLSQEEQPGMRMEMI